MLGQIYIEREREKEKKEREKKESEKKEREKRERESCMYICTQTHICMCV